MKKHFWVIVLFWVLAAAAVLLRSNVPHVQAACTATQDTLCNPIAAQDVPTLVTTIIDYMIGIVGILSALFIVIGGFQYVMSAGNEETAKKARSTILYAAIGLVVAIMAFTIVRIVVNTVNSGQTTTTGTGPTPPPPPPGTTGTCTTTGKVAVNASSIGLTLGSTLTISPTLQGGIPAGCTSGVQILATVRSNSDATRSETIAVPADGATVSIATTGPVFTFPGTSDTFTVTVVYTVSSTPPSQLSTGGAVFTVTK